MTETKEYPILFSAPMVLALLAGTKTQTRRIVKGDVEQVRPPEWHAPATLVHKPTCQRRHCENIDRAELACGGFELTAGASNSPYGKPGDQLWVRETWRTEELREAIADMPSGTDGVRLAADGAFVPIQNTEEASESWSVAAHKPSASGGKWRPSTSMPRWASRLTLEATGVRVERLQDISEADAIAEGVLSVGAASDWRDDPRVEYRLLWESLNGAGSWAVNPFVWVIEFRRRP